MDKGLEQTILQRHTNGQQAFVDEKMLNITNNKRNTNQNNEDGTLKGTEKNKFWKDVEKLKHLCFVGGM